MRKLIASFFVSLDGVVEAPDKVEWQNSTLLEGDRVKEITAFAGSAALHPRFGLPGELAV